MQSYLSRLCHASRRFLSTSSPYTAGSAQKPSIPPADAVIEPLPRTRRLLRDRHCTGPYHVEGQPLPVYPKRRSPLRRTTALIDALNEEECLRMVSSGRAVFPKLVPDPKAGNIISITYSPSLDSPRRQCFTGICIAVRRRGLGSTITLRNVVDGVPIERAFPMYSPTIRHAEVVGNRKTKKLKLYNLRYRPLKDSTFPGATKLPESQRIPPS